jgi:hypothetical protein
VRPSIVIALALAGCAPKTCPSGGCGAAVVRWRLVDAATGATGDGCNLDTHVRDAKDPKRAEECDAVSVHLAGMKLRIVTAGDGGDVEARCDTCRFSCAPREWTTAFEIPAGTYRFSLVALGCDQNPLGGSPPAVVRTVRSGEITNLNSIAISFAPGTSDPPSCRDADAAEPCRGDGSSLGFLHGPRTQGDVDWRAPDPGRDGSAGRRRRGLRDLRVPQGHERSGVGGAAPRAVAAARDRA